MDFKGQYLTHEEYRSLGGSLDLLPFNLLEFEARKQIDLRTQCRLQNTDKIPSEVKLCMFKLVNQIKNYSETVAQANGNLASEQIDGYSVSYITPMSIKEIVASKNAEFNSIIDNDLFGVIVNNEHLIFRGVKC